MRLMVIILWTGLIGASCSSHQPKRLEKDGLAKNPAAIPAAPPAQPLGAVTTNVTLNVNLTQLTVTNGNQIMTLADARMGKIVGVNPPLRFVVIDYSLNLIPDQNQRVFVYRHNVKVGQVKITGPQRLGRIVADILEGDPQVGDEVRNE